MVDTIISLSELVAKEKENKFHIAKISTSKNGRITPIYLDYLDILRNEAITVNFTDEEFYKFRYRPRDLAEYIYGNQEYYHIIMAINNISTFPEFNRKSIKLLRPQSTTLFDIIKNERTNLRRYPAE